MPVALRTYPRRKALPQMLNGRGNPAGCPSRCGVENVNVGVGRRDVWEDLLKYFLLDQRVVVPRGAQSVTTSPSSLIMLPLTSTYSCSFSPKRHSE